MKGKKDKNVSVQISLYSIFDQISNIEYINQYKDYPNDLADQIEDLKTLLYFASSNYTNKARNILNLSKEFNKTIESTLQAVNQLDRPLYQMPQPSYPQLAYQTLKRCTSLQLQEQNQQLDWRAVQTEYQLKFLQSKNIVGSLQWQKCYNSHQRCIQIGKNINNVNISRQSLQRPLQIDLSLKIQNSHIVWQIKKVLYHNNLHYGLLSYYQNELMIWLRQQHNNNLQQSQKHVLSLLYKSIDYVDIILLFIELKNMPFNLNADDSQKKNGILNLFDQKDTVKFAYLKNKNIKVCFLLPYSNFPPSMILRVDGLNALKIQFSENNQILLKIKFKHKSQQMTLKKLVGSIKKIRLPLASLLQIVHQVVQSLQTYDKLVSQKVDQFKLDIFLTNRSTNLMVYLKNLNCVLMEENIAQNQFIHAQIKYDLSTDHISASGVYLIFTSQSYSSLSPLISHISQSSELLIKTANTQYGFVNKILKNHLNMTYQQAMYHTYYLQQIQTNQQKSNWHIKLLYVDIYTPGNQITYKFKQNIQKKTYPTSTILKKDKQVKTDNTNRDYMIFVKISQNFKSIQFIFTTPIAPVESGKSQNSITGNKNDSLRLQNRPFQSQIPERYFRNTWRQYIKKKSQSQVLKNQYLDMDILVKATHYILNHLDFNRFIKGKSGIFKNEDMIQLMDE